MREYLLNIVFVALVAGVTQMLAPASSKSGIGKYVKFLSDLCVLCALTLPISDMYSHIGEIKDYVIEIFDSEVDYYDEYKGIFQENLDDLTKDELCSKISGLVREKFGISEGDVKVNVIFSGEKLKTVEIFLGGAAILKNPYEIESYVSSLLKCEVTVGLQ
jgi:hypothetical protein